MVRDTRKLIVVGDRVLVKPGEQSEKTTGGLYLPPGVAEKEKIQTGYVIKSGPGYPIPAVTEEEPWKESKDPVKYIPLQAKEGDFAIFLRKDAFEIEYEGVNYLIVPQNSILLLIREDLLDF